MNSRNKLGAKLKIFAEDALDSNKHLTTSRKDLLWDCPAEASKIQSSLIVDLRLVQIYKNVQQIVSDLEDNLQYKKFFL